MFASPGDLPNPGIESTSLALAGGLFTTAPPGKPLRLLSSRTAVKTQGDTIPAFCTSNKLQLSALGHKNQSLYSCHMVSLLTTGSEVLLLTPPPAI